MTRRENHAMYRAVIKIFVSLALAVGLSFAVVGNATPANAAPAAEASSAAAAAPGKCAAKKAKVKKAKKAVKKAKKKVKKAKRTDSRKAVKKSKQKVKKAQKKLKKAKKALKKCRANVDPEPNPNDSPIGDLCAMVPAPLNMITDLLCDALIEFIPGGSGDSPIQALCDAGAPQELCDALGDAIDALSNIDPTNPTSLLDAVVDLVQSILDALAGADPTGSLGMLTDQLNMVLDLLLGSIPLPAAAA